jgi:hypothetical protein
LDDQAEGDPVVAEAEDLVALAGQHRVEEDAAEGDLGPALVAEGVVDGQPDAGAGGEGAKELDQQDAPQFVPVPDGFAEEAEGGAVAARGGAAGGLPDAGDGAPAQADGPGGGHEAEDTEDLQAEARAEGL